MSGLGKRGSWLGESRPQVITLVWSNFFHIQSLVDFSSSLVEWMKYYYMALMVYLTANQVHA